MQLADRQTAIMTFMKGWLNEEYGEFMRTSVGILEVLHYYQEPAKDWPSEWKRIKRRPAVCRHTTAREIRQKSTFYIVESWAEDFLEKAKFALAQGGRAGR